MMMMMMMMMFISFEEHSMRSTTYELHSVFNGTFPVKKPARLAIDVNRHLHLGVSKIDPKQVFLEVKFTW